MGKPILSVKLKNMMTAAAPNMDLYFYLKNISINGDKRGCSGFIKNRENNSVVYVSTEVISLTSGFLYRYADDTNDYHGYHNRYAKTTDELCQSIKKMLQTTPAAAGDHRI